MTGFRVRRPTLLSAAIVGIVLWNVPVGAAVTRGPYLNSGSSSGVVVRWRTGSATNSELRYAKTLADLGRGGNPVLVSSAAIVTEHEITVRGLAPGTRYYYAVGAFGTNLAGPDADHWFETFPAPDSTDPTRVWIIGDSGTAGEGAAEVRDAYLAHPGADDTDVWLMLGDNAYPLGTDADYQNAVFDMYPTILRNTVLWTTRGNHDDIVPGDHNDYYDFFTLPTGGEAGGVPSGSEAYYSFDHANIHFVCLDSEGSSASTAMALWLAEDLAANTLPWVIAFWHHPPYTKGTHDSDNPSDSEGKMQRMRENFLPILEAGGTDLVLSGHSHAYERSFLIDGHYGSSASLEAPMKLDPGDGAPSGDGAYRKPTYGPVPHEGTVYTVAGCSGKANWGDFDHPVMVKSLPVMGSVVLDVDSAILDGVFLDRGGVELDRFRIEKGTPTGAPEDPSTQLGLRVPDVYPNPFGRGATIEYGIPSEGVVSVFIHDVQGRRIATLQDGRREAGSHDARWNGRSSTGHPLSPGVYFASVEFGGQIRTKKLVHVR